MAEKSSLSEKTETVLVVDDDPDVLEVAVETLKTLGYRVLAARDGPSALDLLEHNQQIDVLFTDVVMPKGMNGMELAQKARHLRTDIAVILASGYPIHAFAAEHAPTNDFAFLSKPYHFTDLAATLLTIRSMH